MKLREETTPKITMAHPNRGLFCAHNKAAAGMNGFLEQVLRTCTVSGPGCFNLAAPEFLTRLPPCSLQPGKNQWQDLRSASGAWARTGPRALAWFPGTERSHLPCAQKSEEPGTGKHL